MPKHQNIALYAVALLTLTISACVERHGSPPQLTAPSATTLNPTPALPTPAKEQPKTAWDCSKNLVPPTGWEQETAFVDTQSNASQLASDNAKNQLVGRLCGSVSSCEFLSTRITTWKVGQAANTTCAMAVINSKDLAQWRQLQLSLKDLDRHLEKASSQLIGKKGSRPVVAIDRIVDGGVPGGPRAKWLQARMERALNKSGVTVTDIPEGWNGKGLPKGINIIVRALVTMRTENQRPVVEVTWKARYKAPRAKIAKRVADPVMFPTDAAPKIRTVYPNLPSTSNDVSIRLDSRYSGSLCMGERTQIWLHSTRQLHVRVFDLYGADGALLLFPNDTRPDGLVKAGETIPLGGEGGFEAVPASGHDAERFLVIAAKNREDLEGFSNLKGYCRLPARTAYQLHAGQSIPRNSQVTSDGFRLISGDACANTSTKTDPQAQLNALAQLPECR